MKFYHDLGAMTGIRLENPIAKPSLFSHIGEYYSTPQHRISMHAHDTWEFLMQIEGETTWRQKRQTCRVEAGSLLICPPQIHHCLAEIPRGNFRICFLGVDPKRAAAKTSLEQRLPKGRLSVISGGRSLLPSVRRLLEESLTRQPHRQHAIKLLLELFMLEIARLLEGDSPVSLKPTHPVILQMMSLINASPGQSWRLADMARIAGYAPNYLSSLFRQETGQTIQSYVTQTRLNVARHRLLTTRDAITQIALDLGFSSSQHFAKAFQNYYGQTASSLRTTHEKNALSET